MTRSPAHRPVRRSSTSGPSLSRSGWCAGMGPYRGRLRLDWGAGVDPHADLAGSGRALRQAGTGYRRPHRRPGLLDRCLQPVPASPFPHPERQPAMGFATTPDWEAPTVDIAALLELGYEVGGDCFDSPSTGPPLIWPCSTPWAIPTLRPAARQLDGTGCPSG